MTLAGVFAANRITGQRVSDHRFLFQGAGTAALGIADLIVEQMKHEGLTEKEARGRVAMFDIDGLVTADRPGNTNPYAKEMEQLTDLLKVVQAFEPSVIIGVSAVSGAFTPAVLQHMAAINKERPQVLALSNPTSKSECTAEEAYKYTGGRALFASGSPFGEVVLDGRRFEPSQGNNAYIFPAMALSVMACGVKRITDEAFIQAAKALAEEVKPAELDAGRLYPRLNHIRPVTLAIGAKLCDWFYAQGLASYTPEPAEKYQFLKDLQYNPIYDDSYGAAAK